MKKILGLCLALFALPATAATITNGSFETPDVTSSFSTLGAGDTSMGWLVGGAGVDQIDDTYWQAADGHQSLDLNATGNGSITQTLIDLVVGTEYIIRFALAGNPDRNPPDLKLLRVSAGTQFAEFSFDSQNSTYADMGWIEQFFIFTANATSLDLTFAGLSGTSGGAAIDNISIAAVPLPAAGLLLLGALGGLAALRRRRQQVA